MTAARRQGGISLLEVLVAFAIMALSLGVLMQIFGSGARAALRSEDYTKAVLVAQSALELFDLGDRALGEQSGRELERYDWRLVSEPYPDPLLGTGPAIMEPVLVTVEVRWEELGSERRFVLTSLRLRRPV